MIYLLEADVTTSDLLTVTSAKPCRFSSRTFERSATTLRCTRSTVAWCATVPLVASAQENITGEHGDIRAEYRIAWDTIIRMIPQEPKRSTARVARGAGRSTQHDTRPFYDPRHSTRTRGH